MAHIGILLTKTPFQFENWETAVNLADSALVKGHTISLFLYIDGVFNPLKRQSHLLSTKLPNERFSALVEKKARIIVCGTSAKMRGIGDKDYIEGVIIGGLPDFALMLTEVDRLVCL
jgi:tRNA 2-thiouridine synthesizing protein D